VSLPKFLSVRTLLLPGLALAAGLSLPTVAAQQAPRPEFLTTPAQREAIELAAVRGLDYIPGEVIVKFRQGTSLAGQTRALDVLRSRPTAERLQWISDRTARLRVDDDLDSPAIASALARQPEIEYAHPNWLLKPKLVPNDTSYGSRQWNFSAINMPGAWDVNPGGAGITVAVIDSGMTSVTAAYDFKTWNGTAIVTDSMPFAISPDFDAARIATGKDFVFWTGAVLDSDGHGTHVSGTVGQTTNNNLGYAGMAYNAKVMPLKACLSFWDVQILRSEQGVPGYAPLDADFCPTSAVVSAIRYAADNGAKVINLSLGGTNPSPSYVDALNYAVSRGVFVAISAGNEFEDGNPTTYPASYANTIQGVMSVGAVGRSNTRASYSTTGNFVEIVAPGGSGRDGGSAGLIWQAGIFFTDYDPEVIIFPRFDRYSDLGLQGTSMASPHVAGLAALIMSQGITSPAAVEAIITRTALDLGTAGRDNDFGAGLIQPRAALRGFGVVR
jgi:serine protease